MALRSRTISCYRNLLRAAAYLPADLQAPEGQSKGDGSEAFLFETRKSAHDAFVKQLSGVKREKSGGLAVEIRRRVRDAFRENAGETDSATALSLLESGEREFEALARVINGTRGQ